MFRWVTETDKTYKKTQWHFYLTQGDSCVIRFVPNTESGELLDVNDIAKVRFSIAGDDDKILLEKDNLPLEDGKYVLRLWTEDTEDLEVGDFTYEFQITLIGGGVHTPNRYTITITEQNLG